MNKIKRFFEPMLREPSHFIKTFLVQFVASLYIVFNVFFIKEVIRIFWEKDFETLKEYLIIYILINIFYFFVYFLMRHWWWPITYSHHIKMIHQKYLKNFNNLDNTYIENIWTWKSLSIITKWLQKWTDLSIDSIFITTDLLISLVATFIILSDIWLFYTLLFFVIFILFNIFSYFLNLKAIDWRNKRIMTENEYDRQLTKMIMSKFEILQNNKIDKEIKVLDKYSDSITYFNTRFNNFVFTMFTLPDILIFLMILWIFYFMLWKPLSYESLVSTFMIIWMLRQNINKSITFFKDFTKSFWIVEKLWDLIDNWPEIKWLKTWKDFEYKKWEVKIENLNFSYSSNPVFENLSVDFSWWKKIAFVWASWSWKTTLIKLISGFLSPNSWEIIVDWQNLKEVNLNSYYKNIWYLTQEPSVFDWTILENLTYGVDLISENNIAIDEKIKQAIKNASCEFIYDFPEWLNTEIWERWVRLSWWQKQRLAIAKLFVKNPSIIILDEPTSALDSFSEELIKNSFEKLFAWKTVFIIAHRLQTVKHADDILVFEWWKVIERWTHNELIKKNWYYRKMLDLQSGF